MSKDLNKMITKRFILISFFTLVCAVSGFACGPGEPIHNYYMFNVYSHNHNDMYTSRLIDYWEGYIGKQRPAASSSDEYRISDSEYYFGNNNRLLFAAARAKKDAQMITYLQRLTSYNKICEQLQQLWDYPTKAQLLSRRNTLVNLQNVCKTYKGGRLSAQYGLLYMRANMLLGSYERNKAYWLSTGSKLKSSVFTDMMRGLYANALLHTGKWREACDIYVGQSDWLSVEWAMRKYRNLAGIKTIYNEDPNSLTLNYLVQNFVNSAQETIDDNGDKDAVSYLGMNTVYEQEINDFISFASNVVEANKVKDACLWMSASAMLHYLKGEQSKAEDEIKNAMTLNGSQRSKDNARCIRLLILTGEKASAQPSSSFLTEEFRWLDGMSRKEGNGGADGFYAKVMDRVVFKNLVPKYSEDGNKIKAISLIAMINELPYSFLEPQANQHNSRYDWSKKDEYTYNQDYLQYSEYFNKLDSLTADEMVKYYKYIKSTPNDAFESYVISKVYNSDDYFNDFIGTKYIAEGRFGDAIPYLSKVSLTFLKHQNISYYMAHRNLKTDRWFTHQWYNESLNTDGPDLAEITTNPKLDYCKEMIQLQSQYTLAKTDNDRRAAAYTLASRYYQASCYGDGWFITHYAKSVYDSTRTYEKDFAQQALDYLNDSQESTDFDMQQQSIYAKAFIVYSRNVWKHEFDFDNSLAFLINVKEVNDAYTRLSQFATLNNSRVSDYVTKCDILKEFQTARN
jgi:hypothetical protein